MPDILNSRQAFERGNGNQPTLKLLNMFVEATPVAQGGIVVMSRRGLVSTAVRGTGPIRGIFSKPGTFAGDVFSVSGGTLYRGVTSLGAINGTGPVSWAASEIEVVVTRGQTAYSYNGTNLAAITFPDGANVTAVAYLAGLFIYVRAASQKWYWSAVLNGRSVGALDFASAENAPDGLRDAVVVGDSLLLCGQETIETWVPTGALTLPFSRVVQRLYGKGVIATGCGVEQDNSFTFIANDGMVYKLADVPVRISDHGIEERIAASATFSAFDYVYEGHTFFVIRLSQGSWCFDVATGMWCEFGSYGRANWRAFCATQIGPQPLFGDDTDGNIWQFGGWSEGGATLVRTFTAAFPTNSPIYVDTLDVDANVGWTETGVGQASDPELEMRLSRNAGATFGQWRATRLGKLGEYNTRARYRRNGLFSAPGGLFEFRLSDPAPFRVTRVSINEGGGGRGRGA